MSLLSDDRSGFSLVELLTAMTIIGILAGIAIPSFIDATYRADAARIVTDMEAVRFALFEFREDRQSLPDGGRWGETPGDLASYLDQMSFSYKDAEYRLTVNERRGNVQFAVRYPPRSPIGEALMRYRNPGRGAGSVSWTARQTKFRIMVDNE